VSLRHRLPGVSLRHRLVVMMLVLTAVAIAAVDVVTSSEVHSFLIGRLDDQLGVAQDQLVGYVDRVHSTDIRSGDSLASTDPAAWLDKLDTTPEIKRLHLPPEITPATEGISADSFSSRIAPDDFVELIDSKGLVVFEHLIGATDDPSPAPDLVGPLRPNSVSTTAAADDPAFQVGAIGSPSTQYRVEVASVPGGELVIAASTAPTQSTVSSLTHIEILVSVLVMLVLAALVAWMIRLGLRPLEDMTETAGAFAKGDLSRRVRFSDERTEVGRLGGALNGMLVQIESAFGLREQSEARLRRFVADASHDLRTPLTSIRGYAELLRKGAFTEESDRRRALGRIEHEAERMSVLIEDLLLLARIDQGRPLAQDPVELRPLVADAVAAARAVQPGRAISLACPYGLYVQGDAGRIRQAVDNLLRNAIVHTPPESSVEVSVETTPSAVRLSVADDGPGLTREEAEHVFDRFFQADLSRTGQGTGLGLSIVAAIAEAHGGRTWVESVPGVGSIFFLELPVDSREDTSSPDRVSEDADSPERAEQSQGAGPSAPQEGEHVRYGVTR
jgi:two-component system OmpR family sensor kinase